MDTTAFPLSDQVSVTVTIDDVNDNAPMFTDDDLVFRIAENTPAPAPVRDDSEWFLQIGVHIQSY